MSINSQKDLSPNLGNSRITNLQSLLDNKSGSRINMLQDNETSQIQSKERLKKKCKIYRYEPQKCNPFILALLLVPVQFLCVYINESLHTLEIQLAKLLKIKLSQVQWIFHGENIATCLSCLFSTRLYQKFGIQTIFLVSGYLLLLSLIFQATVPPTLVGYIIFRIVQATGHGLCLPTVSPFCNMYSQQDKISMCLVVSDTLIPMGQVTGDFIGSILGKQGDFRYLFIPALIVCVMYCLYATMTLRFSEKINQKFGFDIPGAILLIMFVVGGIGGVAITYFAKLTYYIIAAVLICVSAASIIGFVIYSKRKSRNPILPVQTFNQNTATFIGCFLIQGIGQGGLIYQEPIIWQHLCGYSVFLSSCLIGLCRLTDLLTIFYAKHVLQKCTVRMAVMIFLGASLCNFIIRSIFMLAPWSVVTPFVLLFLSMCSSSMQLAQLTTTQFYNVSHTPRPYGPAQSSMISFSAKASQSIGTAIALFIQTLEINKHGNTTDAVAEGFGIFYIIICVVLTLDFLLARKIGVFKWESNKKGYKKEYTKYFSTFKELQIEQRVKNNQNEHDINITNGKIRNKLEYKHNQLRLKDLEQQDDLIQTETVQYVQDEKSKGSEEDKQESVSSSYSDIVTELKN